MDFEKMKMLQRHAAVISPLIKLLNERWEPVAPAVELKGHPEHDTWVKTVNTVTTISQTVLDMLRAGDL
jgi:hypothetical protein